MQEITLEQFYTAALLGMLICAAAESQSFEIVRLYTVLFVMLRRQFVKDAVFDVQKFGVLVECPVQLYLQTEKSNSKTQKFYHSKLFIKNNRSSFV